MIKTKNAPVFNGSSFRVGPFLRESKSIQIHVANDPEPMPDLAKKIGVPVFRPYKILRLVGLPNEIVTSDSVLVLDEAVVNWLESSGRIPDFLPRRVTVVTPDTVQECRIDDRDVFANRLVFRFCS